MEIDIEDLKKKYQKKTRANIIDMSELQIMVPILIREICRLEGDLNELNSYIKALEKKKPLTEKKGTLGKGRWDVDYDMKKKRLKIHLQGVFDYRCAKAASNAIISILDNVEKGFDVINDIRDLSAITDMRSLFHLRKVRYHLVQAGLNRTIRVSGTNDSLIAGLLEKYFVQGPQMIVVKSMEDAEAALENQGKFLNH